MTSYCIPFKKLGIVDLPLVGGKNATLTEMMQELAHLGIHIPDGFALTTDAYRLFLKENQLLEKLQAEWNHLDKVSLSNLDIVGKSCRRLMAAGRLPEIIKEEILLAYNKMVDGKTISVAVSATAEDLPEASLAGQHDSFLNFSGEDRLLEAIHNCYISLFNDRAIRYRFDNHFEHLQVYFSVGVQTMVHSDKGSAGVSFTIDPGTGSENVIYITSSWGLGENVVQGAITPEKFYVFKRALVKNSMSSIVHSRVGGKESKIIYPETGAKPIKSVSSNSSECLSLSLLDEEVVMLGWWYHEIEKLYKMLIDIEWANDGVSEELYIVQAKPETVHGQRKHVSLNEYSLKSTPLPLCKGIAVGHAIASGRVCIVHSIADAGKVREGDVIVADITNPDWNAMLHRAVCIVTNKGGRTSHASIVARELGIHAVVGTTDATQKLYDGQQVTVSCIGEGAGYVFDGKIDWEENEIIYKEIPDIRTKIMLILADPSKALNLEAYPSMGVGLFPDGIHHNKLHQVLPHGSDKIYRA